MRQMKDSGIEWIGDIPDTWKTNTVFQLFTQVKNKNTDLQEQNLLSLSYGKIKRRSINTTGGLLPESFDGYNIIEVDDIVLRLTDLQNDHKSLRVGLATERGIVTSAYLTIRNRSESLAKYLYYYLHSFDVAKGFYGMGAGVRQGLNWDGIKWLKILSPSVPEQQRIVSFLDTECDRIDAVIEQTRTSIGEYKKLKQSVITRTVTKGIRHDRQMKDSGIPLIGDIPAEWTVQRIKNVAEIYGRIGFRGYTTDDLVEEGEGAITLSPSNLRELKMVYDKCSYISWAKYEESPEIQIENGDILFVKTGSSYGKSSLVSDLPLQATINPQLVVFKNITIDNRFFLYALQTPSLRNEIEGIVSGGTIPTMGQEKMRNFHLCVPKNEEQIEIANYLDSRCSELDKIIGLKEQMIKELEEMRKSTIFEYVTGKKEVPNADYSS